MATAHNPSGTQLSAAAEHRNTMYLQVAHRLQHFAWRALHVLGKRNDDFVVICVEVDSRWHDLVEHLMPGHDWNAVRATGKNPVAQGTIAWTICEWLADEFPDLADVAREVPAEGKAKAIVLNDGGCTIYELVPKPDSDHN